jgi:hypothetical protein
MKEEIKKLLKKGVHFDYIVYEMKKKYPDAKDYEEQIASCFVEMNPIKRESYPILGAAALAGATTACVFLFVGELRLFELSIGFASLLCLFYVVLSQNKK